MAKKEVNVSEAGSVRGWCFNKWLQYNKSNLRLLLSGAFGLASSALSGWSTPHAAGLGVVVATISKLVLDTLDFYVSDVELE